MFVMNQRIIKNHKKDEKTLKIDDFGQFLGNGGLSKYRTYRSGSQGFGDGVHGALWGFGVREGQKLRRRQGPKWSKMGVFESGQNRPFFEVF